MSQQGTVSSFNYEPAQLVPHHSPPPSSPSPNQQTQASSSPQSQYTGNGGGGHQSNLPQNEDSVIMNNGMPISPAHEQERDEAGYLNGLDYTICFRKEIGFCTQTYYINSTMTPFEILNTDNGKCLDFGLALTMINC